MRVLLSGDSFPPKLDGVQNFARNTIQALVRDGHKVHVFGSNGSPTTHLAPENYGATVTRGPGVEVQPKHKILDTDEVAFSTSNTFEYSKIGFVKTKMALLTSHCKMSTSI